VQADIASWLKHESYYWEQVTSQNAKCGYTWNRTRLQMYFFSNTVAHRHFLVNSVYEWNSNNRKIKFVWSCLASWEFVKAKNKIRQRCTTRKVRVAAAACTLNSIVSGKKTAYDTLDKLYFTLPFVVIVVIIKIWVNNAKAVTVQQCGRNGDILRVGKWRWKKVSF